jgi:predicted outer membrane repeat protein
MRYRLLFIMAFVGLFTTACNNNSKKAPKSKAESEASVEETNQNTPQKPVQVIKAPVRVAQQDLPPAAAIVPPVDAPIDPLLLPPPPPVPLLIGVDEDFGDNDDDQPDVDECPDDPLKQQPGACGCGVPDLDTDNDTLADCNDNCPANANINQRDSDNDGQPDACDCRPNEVSIGAYAGLTRYVDPTGSDLGNDCQKPVIPCQTIAHAIEQASAGDGIWLSAGTFPESGLVVDKNLVIFGQGNDDSTVDGQGLNRVFTFNAEIDATLCELTVANGSLEGDGGGIFNGGSLIVASVDVEGNSAINGGGLRATAASTTLLSETTFQDNNASTFGGGINNEGNLTLDNVALIGNTSAGAAGGLANIGTATISESFVVENTANSSGGGIASDGAMTIFGSLFLFNAAENGGAIASGGSLDISSSILAINQAGSLGGAISSADNNLTINQTYIIANVVEGSGAGINSDGNVTITDSFVAGNRAGDFGGGMREADVTEISPTINIIRTTFAGNLAGLDGGGLHLSSQNVDVSTANLINSTFAENSASNGGGLYVANNSVININNSTMAENTAAAFGGAIYKESLATATSFHSILADNTIADCATNAGNVFNTANWSMFGDNSCTFSAGANNYVNVDPMLGFLTFAGGFAPTYELEPLSPAIDAGNQSCNVNTDQRELPRPVNIVGVSPIDNQTRCDIGAVEVQP